MLQWEFYLKTYIYIKTYLFRAFKFYFHTLPQPLMFLSFPLRDEKKINNLYNFLGYGRVCSMYPLWTASDHQTDEQFKNNPKALNQHSKFSCIHIEFLSPYNIRIYYSIWSKNFRAILENFFCPFFFFGNLKERQSWEVVMSAKLSFYSNQRQKK